MREPTSDRCSDCFWWYEDPTLCENCSSNQEPKKESNQDWETEQSQMGFTLIELVTIVGIISLLLIVVSLNFSTWRANARLKSTARDVASQMQLARVEAARLDTSILIQITTGGPGIGKSVVFVDDGSESGTDGCWF